MKTAPQHVPLQLCVDSQPVTAGVTLWLPGLIRQEWKRKWGGSDGQQEHGTGTASSTAGAITTRMMMMGVANKVTGGDKDETEEER